MRRFTLLTALMLVLGPAFVLTSSGASAATVSSVAVASSPAPTATDATLTWNAYPGAVKYRVYWSTSSSMPSTCAPNCTVLSSFGDPAHPSVTLHDALAAAGQSVVSGKTYYVKVSAINSGGTTITSWQSTPTTVKLVGAPPDGGTIPATVQNIHTTSLTETDATIAWDKVPTAATYRVYWSTSASMSSSCAPNCTVITPGDLANPSVTLHDAFAAVGQSVTAGQKYYIKVSAINSSSKTITGWQTTPTTVDLVGEPLIDSVWLGVARIGNKLQGLGHHHRIASRTRIRAAVQERAQLAPGTRHHQDPGRRQGSVLMDQPGQRLEVVPDRRCCSALDDRSRPLADGRIHPWPGDPRYECALRDDRFGRDADHEGCRLHRHGDAGDRRNREQAARPRRRSPSAATRPPRRSRSPRRSSSSTSRSRSA